MQGSWKDFFSFNKRERNGIFVLSTLIIALIGVQVAMPYFISNEIKTDTSALDAYIVQLKKDSADWVAQNELKYKAKYKSKYSKKNYNSKTNIDEPYLKKPIMEGDSYNKYKSEKWAPHSFDPNNATDKDWADVGLNKGQIKSINKYLGRGGEFKKKLDVAKMYVINESQYLKMEAFIMLPDSVPKRKANYRKDSLYASSYPVKYPKKKYYDTIIIELNLADTTMLKKLKGIGSYYARKIVYQREKLGGFYSVAQLYEIERMRKETVLKIIPFLTVDTNLIQKIHINSDLAPQMVKHPYMTWNMAISIQDYRDFSHKFKSVRDLVKNGLLNEELYIKLAPYLEL